MILRWLTSRTIRQAVDLRKQVLKMLNHQRDLLTPKAIQAVETACADLHAAVTGGLAGEELRKKMEACEEGANKWLKPYPHASVRENIELFLVAVAVAMAIRTFFLQPFKIPTGSMQPTLFGITSDPDFGKQIDFPTQMKPETDFEVPNGLKRLADFWIKGVQYKQIVARSDGVLRAIGKPVPLLLFNLKQDFVIGDETYTVWFPTDDFFRRAGLQNGYGQLNPRRFKRGEDIVKIRIVTGDHLFVDRLTYNFRQPKRGEIIVFETTGTSIPQQDTCYIKRLVGLGGEQIRIGNDRHLVINGERLDSRTPHFELVYSFDPRKPPHDSQYSGHLNQTIAEPFRQPWQGPLAPNFPDEKKAFSVPPHQYVVMGDNTMNSYDSRGWGCFPEGKVMGRASFVYWPFGKYPSSRFGFGYR